MMKTKETTKSQERSLNSRSGTGDFKNETPHQNTKNNGLRFEQCLSSDSSSMTIGSLENVHIRSPSSSFSAQISMFQTQLSQQKSREVSPAKEERLNEDENDPNQSNQIENMTINLQCHSNSMNATKDIVSSSQKIANQTKRKKVDILSSAVIKSSSSTTPQNCKTGMRSLNNLLKSLKFSPIMMPSEHALISENLMTLPTGLHFAICVYLHPQDIYLHLKRVNKYFNQLSRDPLLWNYLNRFHTFSISTKYHKTTSIVERRSKGRLYSAFSRLNNNQHVSCFNIPFIRIAQIQISLKNIDLSLLFIRLIDQLIQNVQYFHSNIKIIQTLQKRKQGKKHSMR